MRAGLVSKPVQSELIVCSIFVYPLIKAIVMTTSITGSPPVQNSALMLRSMQKPWSYMAMKKTSTLMKKKRRKN